MSKSNMFAALASDSDDEYKAVESKKTTAKDKAAKMQKDETREVVGTRRTEEGDFDYGPNKTRASRGRGGRGRGDRGRGRGGYGFEGESRGGRGGYRGRGFGRGGDRGRGFGRGGRGRGGRGSGYGGRGGKYSGPRDQYSKLATREQVTGHGEEVQEHHEEPQEWGKDRYYERKSGTGYGKEVKKGGAGKGGWGAPEADTKLEHLEAETAVKIVDTEGEENKEEKPSEGTHVEFKEDKKEEEEEEVNNLTYSEYIAQKKAAQGTLKKGTARKPEELKVKNIQNYEKNDYSVKGFKSNVAKGTAYAPSGLTGDVEFGFQPLGDEPEETYERSDRGGRGRGRGGRGGYRGGRGSNRGAPHEDHYQAKRSQVKKFVANEDDFPAL